MVRVNLIDSHRYFIFNIKSSEKVSESVEFYEQFFRSSYSETDFSQMRQSIWMRIFLCTGRFYVAEDIIKLVVRGLLAGQQFWLNRYCLSIFTFLPPDLIILEVNGAESYPAEERRERRGGRGTTQFSILQCFVFLQTKLYHQV